MISHHYSYPAWDCSLWWTLVFGDDAFSPSELRAGASRPMAQPVVQPPVTYVSLVSNYPSPRAKRERKPLSEVLTPNQPAVLHLFTG